MCARTPPGPSRRPAAGPGRPPAHRAQVVLLRAHERPVPGPGPGPGRADLLPAPPGAARRRPATPSGCSGSRTSWATGPTPPPRSSSTPRSPGRSARPAGACATIIEMVSATRLDCVLGSAAGMRLGCVTAVHYATHRRAFGASLISQPLMASVLADLALESEAATTLALRLAGCGRPGRPAGTRREARPAAGRAARRQVLGLQARAAARRRGAGVPRRQRLRGGVRHAPAVPRGAAELDLGGLRQRDRPGRAPRARQRQQGAADALAGRAGPGRGRRPAARRGAQRAAPGCCGSWPPGDRPRGAVRGPAGWPG